MFPLVLCPQTPSFSDRFLTPVLIPHSLLLLLFFENFIPCIPIIFTLLFQLLSDPSIPFMTNFVSSSKNEVQFVLPIYSWMCALSFEYGRLMKGYMLGENWLSLSQQVSVTSGFSTTDGTFYLPPISTLGFGLA